MPILVLLLIEVFFFFFFADRFGFLQTMAGYWLPTVLFAWFFPFAIRRLKNTAFIPTTETGSQLRRHLGTLLNVVGFILFIIPLLSTRLLGFVFLLPGLHHFVIWKFHKNLKTKANFYYAKFSPDQPFKDVTPTKIITRSNLDS